MQNKSGTTKWAEKGVQAAIDYKKIIFLNRKQNYVLNILR